MKRALALALAMILCLGLLASCGNNDSNGSNGSRVPTRPRRKPTVPSRWTS